jgi:hypothetical protein
MQKGVLKMRITKVFSFAGMLAFVLTLSFGIVSCESKEKKISAIQQALEAGDPAAFTTALQKIKEGKRKTVIQTMPATTIAAALKSGADFGEYTEVMAGTLTTALESTTPELITALAAYASPGGDFKYELHENSITITEYTGTNPVVIIPAEIEGYPVTQIGKYNPMSRRMYNLTPVNDFPDAYAPGRYDQDGRFDGRAKEYYKLSVQTRPWATVGIFSESMIGANDPSFLVAVVIPASVERIGHWAFYMNDTLQSVVLPDSDMVIGKEAFTGCQKLPLATRDKLKALGYPGTF